MALSAGGKIISKIALLRTRTDKDSNGRLAKGVVNGNLSQPQTETVAVHSLKIPSHISNTYVMVNYYRSTRAIFLPILKLNALVIIAMNYSFILF